MFNSLAGSGVSSPCRALENSQSLFRAVGQQQFEPVNVRFYMDTCVSIATAALRAAVGAAAAEAKGCANEAERQGLLAVAEEYARKVVGAVEHPQLLPHSREGALNQVGHTCGRVSGETSLTRIYQATLAMFGRMEFMHALRMLHKRRSAVPYHLGLAAPELLSQSGV